jgi:hypothetical protein
MPRSVQYACGLLTVQAALWAMAALGTAAIWTHKVNWKPAAHSPAQLAAFILEGILAFALTGGLAAGSALLAAGLARGRRAARLIAVLLEASMACFGVLIADYTASAGAGIIAAVPVLAGLTGTALSLAATICLLLKHARRFTTGHRLASAG